jgi:uncharacterized membrane protein
MTWTILLATHAFAASVALPLGAWQLFFSSKGDERHRFAGRVWVGLMLYVSFTSFWIKELDPGEFSLIHILSVVTIVTVSLGLWSAVRGNIESHRGNMIGSWLGLMGAFIGAVAVPVRHIPTFVVTEPVDAAVAAVLVLLTTVAIVAAGGVSAAARADGSGLSVAPARPTAPRPPRGSRR